MALLGSTGTCTSRTRGCVSTTSRGDPPTAPLLLLLHGFPQNWFCWRHLLQDLGTRYRVVALDLRGYGASEKPPGRDSYRLEVLLEDIRQVIEILGPPPVVGEGPGATEAPPASSKCILVGHDWGGLLAWEVASSHPEMVEKLVIMDAPHRAVMAGFMACHLSQLLRSSYIFLFQLPWLPELLLSLADFELVRTALTGSWLGIQNAAQRLTEQEVDAYLYGLSQPGGLTPPLNYYRNLFRDTPIPREPPPLPTLLLWGAEDAFLDARLVPCLRRCLRPTARLPAARCRPLAARGPAAPRRPPAGPLPGHGGPPPLAAPRGAPPPAEGRGAVGWGREGA
ncbi:epoxide hydrolase 3 [Falco biarmicus]|uniref:epoxide hydrolase 3 n=1 Tax=Falco biarmicus TaxID=345155 RepID=UPI0024BD3255|nr:epoxide hydrolase 3 [Falco biarmicus]